MTEGTAPPTETLVLTSDDINALLEDDPELKGKAYAKIEGNVVKGEISIPLDAIPGGKGRYLNGEAEFKASLADGVLIVTLDSVEVNGKQIPEEFMKPIRQQNLAKDLYKDEKTSEMIRRLESLEIKDGKIILKVRPKAAADAAKPTEAGEDTKKAAAPPASDQPKSAPPPDEPKKTGAGRCATAIERPGRAARACQIHSHDGHC